MAVCIVGLQADAVAETVALLRDAGRVPDDADALVAMVGGLAAAVDRDPSNAALWREYRQALAGLMEVGGDGSDDDTAAFLISVSTPGRRAALGNPADA